MLNKVLLIGNTGNEPDVKVLPNGSKVANISLATSENWKDKSGQRQSRTEWHRIVIYSEPLIGIIEKYVHKGSKLYVEGSLRSRKYEDSNGVSRTSVEIIVQGYSDTIKLLDKKDSEMGSERRDSKEDEMRGEPQDDEIPF
jgi:single-strand DNA-binding protein